MIIRTSKIYFNYSIIIVIIIIAFFVHDALFSCRKWDKFIINNYLENENLFVSLKAQIENDSFFKEITLSWVGIRDSVSTSDPVFSTDKKVVEYRKKMKDLNLSDIASFSKGEVIFESELINSCSMIGRGGYQYSEKPPENIVSNIAEYYDNYKFEMPGAAFQHIKNNWYLYFIFNKN